MTVYADLSNLADILKNVYGEGITNQFNDERTTYNLFPKSDRKPGGKGYIFGIRYARTQSVGARAESVPLPDPMTGLKDQGTITPKYIYGTIRLTGPAIEAAKANAMAFVDGLADEMDDIYQSVVNQMNRQAHSDGFGLLATTTQITTPSTTATWAATCDNDTGVQYCQEGMIVDFYTGATPEQDAFSQRISAVYPATKKLIFEIGTDAYVANHPITAARSYTVGQTAMAAGALLISQGARTASHATTNTPYEVFGLDAIFDDATLLATFEAITVATNPKWQANIISNAAINRELSLDLMLNACEMTRVRSGKNVDTIMSGLGQKRKYANLLLPDVRFQPGTLKGGYETVTFAAGDGSVKMIFDPLAQKNKMYFYPDGVVQKYELAPLGWGNLDGDQMHRRAGYDEWDLFLRLYTQLGCEQRNCLTKVTDLVEPQTY
jgi:hypothetical protein